MPDLPNSADIRQFLFDFFNDEEFTTLCFDYFPEVQDNFSRGMTKAEKVQLLLEYCHRRKLIPNLPAALQRARPEPYATRFPQVPKAESPVEPIKVVRGLKQVFISHAHQDAEFAHKLANDLRQNGWRVWIAPDSIRPGEKWAEAIERGLSESDVFAVALTPAAVQSRWVRDETFVAIELEKKGRMRFVPLAVEPCDVPNLWSTYQRIPFQGNYGSGLTALFDALEPERRARREREMQETVQPIAPQPLPQPENTFKPQIAHEPRPLLWGRIPVPKWTLLAAGVAFLVVALLVCCIGYYAIANNAASSAATQTAVAAARRPTPTSPPSPVPQTPTLTRSPAPLPTGTFTSAPSPTATRTPTLMPSPTPTLGIGSTRVSEKDGMVMVYVPAGEFLMGSADADIDAILAGCKDCRRDWYTNEQPQHKVYLDAFWIDQTEVTNTQYKKCVQAATCLDSKYANDSRYNGDNQPIGGVDWYNAKAYCEWAGRQLPTEAQWEKAARGTDGRIYPWGDQTATCEYAVMYLMGDSIGAGCGKGGFPWAVRSKPKGVSPYGALDMAGNVYEWTADWYDEKYYGSSPPTNPTGPTSGQRRAMRSGNYKDIAEVMRAARRFGNNPQSGGEDYYGFRCSRGTSP